MKFIFSCSKPILYLTRWLRSLVSYWFKHSNINKFHRAVFTWVSKVNCVCFGFALPCLVIGLKICTTFSANQNKNRNQSCFARTRFPVLRASYMCLLWVLIGSLDGLCPLWLAGVITLVLILRHSIENCSISAQPCIILYVFHILTVTSHETEIFHNMTSNLMDDWLESDFQLFSILFLVLNQNQ